MPKRKREKEKKKRNEKQRAAQSRAERTRCAHARALARQVGRASGERGSGRQGGVRGLFSATERGGHGGPHVPAPPSSRLLPREWEAGLAAARLQMEGPRQAQGLSCASSTRLTLRRGQKWS